MSELMVSGRVRGRRSVVDPARAILTGTAPTCGLDAVVPVAGSSLMLLAVGQARAEGTANAPAARRDVADALPASERVLRRALPADSAGRPSRCRIRWAWGRRAPDADPSGRERAPRDAARGVCAELAGPAGRVQGADPGASRQRPKSVAPLTGTVRISPAVRDGARWRPRAFTGDAPPPSRFSEGKL